jgi:predicted glycosyltransferase
MEALLVTQGITDIQVVEESAETVTLCFKQGELSLKVCLEEESGLFSALHTTNDSQPNIFTFKNDPEGIQIALTHTLQYLKWMLRKNNRL